ncbi:flagellar basal body-associated FliL family protein [Candidatus Halocynthiibacter alkanivorans]|uniref:flagellar basal body-associated FliL family protein n=1 Tax=Candidatus Halocynthiibacter alkanivorans TaxID=2267619 RepID=UPI000DF429EF|nr:flagellar basal body-associated FliL family protein [Candidatus Halocynthiibacter alkanivorans]
MADEELEDGKARKKGSKKPMMIGIVLALLLGGGGFFAVYSGAILTPDSGHLAEEATGPEEAFEPLPEVAFVEVDPLIINMSRNGQSSFLRFKSQLEVNPKAESDVVAVMPRIVDVLNGYLRAVDMTELEDPAALIRLRAQMLRRVQVVAGEGRVRDLLIMEFVLS